MVLVTRITKYGVRLLPFFMLVALITGIIGPGTAVAADWYDSDWDYRKKITINAAGVTADLTDFPVLISLDSDSDLAAKALDNAHDIFFTGNSGNKLNHEIEYFNGTTGRLVAWVNVPSVLDLTGAEIYIYYGNAAAPDQQNAAGVWDSNYKLVQHMEETSGAVLDSTQYGNLGTAGFSSGSMDAAGAIDGANDFGGADQISLTDSSAILPSNTNLTFSAWVKLDSYNSNTTTTFVPNRVFSILQDSQNSNVAFGVSHTGYLAGFTRNGATATEFTGDSLSTGQWYYISLVKSGTTYQLYLNGAVSGSAQTYAAPASQPSANPAYVGHDWGSGSRHFYGIIDELRVSDIARSADWITTAYNNQSNPSGFITLGSEENNFVVPTVATSAPASVEETSAILNGLITGTGGVTVTERGFEWDTDAGFFSSSNWTESGSFGVASFSHALPGGALVPGQKYYYRAIAGNSVGWAQGDAVSFVTKPKAPSDFTALSGGINRIDLSWTNWAGADSTMIRGKLGSYPSSVSDGYLVYSGSLTAVSDTGLSDNTTYYYRAWSEVIVDAVSYWSGPIDAFATTDEDTPGPEPPVPATIGGKVFTVNKAAVLAPWLAISIAGAALIVFLALHIRKKYISRVSGNDKK